MLNSRPVHTIHETLVILLQVCFCALATRTNRHCVVLIRVSGWRELVEVRANLVLPNDQKADSVRAATVLLGVYLSLYDLGIEIKLLCSLMVHDTHCRQLQRRDGLRVLAC